MKLKWAEFWSADKTNTDVSLCSPPGDMVPRRQQAYGDSVSGSSQLAGLMAPGCSQVYWDLHDVSLLSSAHMP